MFPDWLSSNFEILPQLLINSLITGSIYALASSGLALTYGITHVLNFAHGHLLMLGAYLFFGFFVLLEMHFATSAVLTCLSLVVVGNLCFLFFIQPFARINSLLPFVTTLALSAVLEALVSLGFGVNVQSLPAGSLASSWSFWNLYVTPLQVIIIVLTIFLLLMLAIGVHCSRWGRIARAISANPSASQALGVNINKTLLCSFTIGVLLAGIAGVLIGFETNLQPTMGNNFTIKAFAAMILGGMGNIWGTVLGAYILGFVENFAIGLDFAGYSLPAGYRDAFAFMLILLTLLIKPSGLLGRKGREI